MENLDPMILDFNENYREAMEHFYGYFLTFM